MKPRKKVDRSSEILSVSDSGYFGSSKNSDSKCSGNTECKKTQDAKGGLKKSKSEGKRANFKGSANISNGEQPKPEHIKKQLSSYYQYPSTDSELEGTETGKSRKYRRKNGSNSHNQQMLHPMNSGKQGSFVEKFPEYKLYESVHRMSGGNNSFLSTGDNPVYDHITYDRSQESDDSYIGESPFFLSDETKLPAYIASFIGGFIAVIVLLIASVYVWTKLKSCLGLRKKPSKNSIKLLTQKGDIDGPCMAEKRAENPNLTKIEDYITGPKAGSYDDDSDGLEDEIGAKHVGYFEYHDEDEDDDDEGSTDAVDKLFKSLGSIKEEGLKFLGWNKNVKKGQSGEFDDAEKLLGNNDYTNELNKTNHTYHNNINIHNNIKNKDGDKKDKEKNKEKENKDNKDAHGYNPVDFLNYYNDDYEDKDLNQYKIQMQNENQHKNIQEDLVNNHGDGDSDLSDRTLSGVSIKRLETKEFI